MLWERPEGEMGVSVPVIIVPKLLQWSFDNPQQANKHEYLFQSPESETSWQKAGFSFSMQIYVSTGQTAAFPKSRDVFFSVLLKLVC